MRTLLFEYGHTNIGSWDRKWPGEGRVYAKSKKIYKEQEEFLASKGISMKIGEQTTFIHNFEDGWTAKVTVTVGRASDFADILKRSEGFLGYDWMIDNILEHGRILTQKELKA